MLIRPARITVLLVVTSVCIFRYVLQDKSGFFCELEATLQVFPLLLLLCIAVWFGSFVFLTFSLGDMPLIGLFLIAIGVFIIGYPASLSDVDAIVLLAGLALGKGARVLLCETPRMKNEVRNSKVGNPYPDVGNILQIGERKFTGEIFLTALVGLLAFSSWWHLDVAQNFYPKTRWMGLWDNPNIYGMLMGTGATLAIALKALCLKSKAQSPKSEPGRKFATVFLSVAITIMGVGLVMSYSRGAWLATAVALAYLAWCYGRLKWRFILLMVLVTVTIIALFWHSTADTDSWYLKRLDFSRPSAQHRVSAWRGGLQMMWDYPLGVGWNQAVSVYDKNYSPPEAGAAALTMNSYLMLGTELGLPGLLCFVAYVGLCLRGKCKIENIEGRIQAACRAGALPMLVAFWFDGGLFTLPTATIFWVLLELGANRGKEEVRMQNAEILA